MTELLAKALREVARLPDAEQDTIAALILAELEDDRIWTEQFDASQEVLARIAEEVRRDYQAGRTEPLDPDNL